MEKSDKKRILTKILIVIAALTLLSCCFLGSTFAKYVTSSSGTVSVGVAKWDVSLAPEGSGTVTIDKLSPDVDGSTHDTGWIKVAYLTNRGDVAAKVTISGSELTVANGTWVEGADGEDGWSQYVSDAEMNKMFKIEFATSNTGTPSAVTTVDLPATTGSVELFAKVTWTTQSDEQDTFYGENLTALTWTIKYSAVQTTELPA